MKTIPYILSVLMCVVFGMLTACSSKADEPANFTEVGQPAFIRIIKILSFHPISLR